MVILGAGVIGCEYATIFSNFANTKVCITLANSIQNTSLQGYNSFCLFVSQVTAHLTAFKWWFVSVF